MIRNFVITLIAVFIIVLIVKIFIKSTKVLTGILINSVVGAIILWALGLMDVPVTITWWSALLTGIFGIPGLIVVLILQLGFHIV